MTSMMMERATMAGMSTHGMGNPMMGSPSTMLSPWMMVPRCTMKFEKCQGGMKIVCTCDDKMACSMMQNLCSMQQGGMVSCYMMMNGMMVCCCNMTMGICRCETTDKGVCVTCTSGDSKCCEMIQACCECLSCMTKAGCTCCVMMNNIPACCGC